MKKTFILSLILVLFAGAAHSDAYTLDDEYAARLCISEASGVRTNDCRVITWLRRERAEAAGVSVAGYIATHHYRHISSESRPYMAFMNRRLECPGGWPGGCVAWDASGRAAWEDVLQLTHRVLTGTMGHGCAEAPADWGGRTVDCEDLQSRLRGDWHEVACGNTVNMMLARGHHAPVPDLQCAERRAAAYQARMARRAASAR